MVESTLQVKHKKLWRNDATAYGKQLFFTPVYDAYALVKQ